VNIPLGSDESLSRRQVVTVGAVWKVRRTTAASVAASGLLLLIHALADSQLTPLQRMLGAVPGLTAIALIARYLRRPDLGRLPFIEYALVQFYVYWGMPTLVFQGGARRMYVSDEAATASLIAVNVVVACAVLAEPLGARLGSRFSTLVERSLPAHAPAKRLFLYVPWTLFALAVHAGWVGDAVPLEYRNVVNLMGSFVPLLVSLAMAAGENGRRKYLLPLTTALAFSVVAFATGMMEKVITPLIVVALVLFFYRRTVPLRLGVVVAALIFVINPTKHAYRSIAWADADSRVERDPIAALRNWGEAFKRTWLDGEVMTGEKVEGLGERFNELAYIGPTFELCPSLIPHQKGSDWIYIPLSVVPRALYPDKPDYTELYNNRFNVAFGFQTVEMTRTSTSSFPLVSDGYWNFGWPGVVVVGLMAGLAFGIFGAALTTRTWGGMSLAALVFSELHAHTHLARILTGTLQQYLAIAAVCWAVILVDRIATAASGRSSLPRARAVTGGTGR